MSQRTGISPVLWASCLAVLGVGANSTAIMAALPSMRGELGLSAAGVEWAVNSYLVVSAAFVVLGGQMAGRFGAKLAAMIGMALFGAASCLIAIAGSEAMLLAATRLAGLRGGVRGAEHARRRRPQRDARSAGQGRSPPGPAS